MRHGSDSNQPQKERHLRAILENRVRNIITRQDNEQRLFNFPVALAKKLNQVCTG